MSREAKYIRDRRFKIKGGIIAFFTIMTILCRYDWFGFGVNDGNIDSQEVAENISDRTSKKSRKKNKVDYPEDYSIPVLRAIKIPAVV